MGNGQIAQSYIRRMNGNRPPAPVADNLGGTVGRAFDGNGFVDIEFGFVCTGGKLERIAGLGARQSIIEIVLCGYVDDCGKGRLNHAAKQQYECGTLPFGTMDLCVRHNHISVSDGLLAA